MSRRLVGWKSKSPSESECDDYLLKKPRIRKPSDADVMMMVEDPVLEHRPDAMVCDRPHAPTVSRANGKSPTKTANLKRRDEERIAELQKRLQDELSRYKSDLSQRSEGNSYAPCANEPR